VRCTVVYSHIIAAGDKNSLKYNMKNETRISPRAFLLANNDIIWLVILSLAIILLSSGPSDALMAFLPRGYHGHRLHEPVSDTAVHNIQQSRGIFSHPYRENNNIGSAQLCEEKKNPIPTRITRCSSRDAAALIKSATILHSSPSSRSLEENLPLLVITCDASGRGGGSKHDGIASVLRMRCSVSLLSSNSSCTSGGNNHGGTDTNEIKRNSNVGVIPSKENDHSLQANEDLIDTIARRTVPSRKSSEVAAISLGIRRALQVVPSKLRKRILILSDSEFALDFYCSGVNDGGSGGGGSGSANNTNFHSYRNFESEMIRGNKSKMTSRKKKRKGTTSSKKKHQKVTPGMAIREDAYRRSLHMLVEDDATRAVFFAKVKSSSRGAGLILSNVTKNGDFTDMADEETLSWDGTGFIDHDAADYLSSATRSMSNNDNSSKNNIDEPSGLGNHLKFRSVATLSEVDLDWLANSESSSRLSMPLNENVEERQDSDEISFGGSESWRTVNVLGSNARDDRLKRNKRRKERIWNVLGLE